MQHSVCLRVECVNESSPLLLHSYISVKVFYDFYHLNENSHHCVQKVSSVPHSLHHPGTCSVLRGDIIVKHIYALKMVCITAQVHNLEHS